MSLENAKDKVVGKATELKGKATGSKLDEIKGKAQNFLGKATGSKLDEIKGKAQNFLGKAKDSFDEARRKSEERRNERDGEDK